MVRTLDWRLIEPRIFSIHVPKLIAVHATSCWAVCECRKFCCDATFVFVVI